MLQGSRLRVAHTRPHRIALGDHRRGVAFALLAAGGFATLDALAKETTATHSLFGIVWIRYVVHAAVVGAFILATAERRRSLGAVHLPSQLARGCLLLISTLTFFAALSVLPLAQASAISSTGPIFLTILAVPLLRERVTRAQLIGVVVAFGGALLVIRPGSDLFGLVAVLPLCTAITHSLYQIITRRYGGRDSAAVNLFFGGLVGAIAMTVLVVVTNTPIDAGTVIAGMPLGIIALLSHLALLTALQSAPVGSIAPLSYTSLIWATVFGFIGWGDIPDVVAVAGMIAICCGGIVVMRMAQRRTVDLVLAIHPD